MTWIARKIKYHILDTHYYLGLTSLCGTTHLDEKQNISYEPRILHSASYCKICQDMLKTKNIHKKIKLQEAKLKLCQDRLKRNLKTDIKLQDMVLRYLKHPDTKTPVNISEMKKIFQDDCLVEIFEDVLVPLVISQKISIFEDGITPCFMEEQYVK